MQQRASSVNGKIRPITAGSKGLRPSMSYKRFVIVRGSSKARPLSQSVSTRNKSGFMLSASQEQIVPSFPFFKINNSNSNTNQIRPISGSKGSININFRQIRPSSRYQGKCFNKYWQSTAIQSKIAFSKSFHSKHGSSNSNSNSNSNISLLDKIISGNRLLYKYPHINWTNKIPSSFLTNIGGNEFNKTQYETTTLYSSRPITAGIPLIKENDSKHNNNTIDTNTKTHTLKATSRPFTAVIQSRNNVDTNATTTHNTKKRLISADTNSKTNGVPVSVIKKINTAHNNHYKYTHAFFNEISPTNTIANTNAHTPLNKRLHTLLHNYTKINVKSYSIKTAQADSDLLEIFDRSQRTHAATLTKVGDYTYYRTYQRIGSFMDYSMHMKYEHLKNIESHVNQSHNNMLYYKSKHSTLPIQHQLSSIITPSKYFNDPNSLFHGLMPYEYSYNTALPIDNTPSTTYDPINYLDKYTNDYICNEAYYDKSFCAQVQTSINNYNKYIVSSKIHYNDLKTFNSNALKHALTCYVDVSLKHLYKTHIDSYLTEIEETYYNTLKRIIMNYILRSPHERKRLNITFIPRTTLPSSYTIALHGSFNRSRYTSWTTNYANACNSIKHNLTTCNVAISGLIEWTRCFNHVNLIYLTHIDTLRDKGINCIQIDDFSYIEVSYMNKCKRFIRDVYYRGVILLVKKNKVLKRKDMSIQGKWTFKGYIPNIPECLTEYNDVTYGMRYEDVLNDFWSNVDINDLIDIRLTPSYYVYASYVLGKQIDLFKSEYSEMEENEKRKLNTSVTTYCVVFFRKVIEKALKEYCEYFVNVKSSNELLMNDVNDNSVDSGVSSGVCYNEKDIVLPQLLTFKISHVVNPLISLNMKYDAMYNVVNIEYTFEEVYNKITHVIDCLCNVFNDICIVQDLEFRTTLPSEREQVVKEHSSRVNEYFNMTPNQNKSFQEEYYSNICPHIIIDDADSSNSYMKTYIHVMNTTDHLVNDIKSKIYNTLKTHYNELNESINVFTPLNEVISNSLDEQIRSFTKASTSLKAVPDYSRYTYFIDKINMYQRYISSIPNKLQYALFAVDTRNAKTAINDKLVLSKQILMQTLENNIIHIYTANILKYKELTQIQNVKLLTPEDVVEMEQKIKPKALSELSEVHRSNEDAYKIFLYLIKIGHIFSDELINTTCNIVEASNKYKNIIEKINTMHKEDREALETQFMQFKHEIEDDIETYINDIDVLDTQTRINEYDKVLSIIEALEMKQPSYEERIRRVVKEEELLFEVKIEGYDMYELGKRKLMRLGVIWRSVKEFYEVRKELICKFNENVNFDYYNNVFNEIDNKVNENRKALNKGEDVVGKISKVLIDDIVSVSNFLRVVQQVIITQEPLGEELKREVIDILDSKRMETSCREILFNYFSRKS